MCHFRFSDHKIKEEVKRKNKNNFEILEAEKKKSEGWMIQAPPLENHSLNHNPSSKAQHEHKYHQENKNRRWDHKIRRK